MDIKTFPKDIFLIIASYLSPSDLILSRCISKAFQAAFTNPSLCYLALLQYYPRARELRGLSGDEDADWADTFSKVAGNSLISMLPFNLYHTVFHFS